MASSHRNAFHWPFVRECDSFRFQRVSNVGLWCFTCRANLKNLLNKQSRYRWFQTPWRSCQGTAFLLQSDTIASLVANGSTAFKWKLYFNWLAGLRQRQIEVIKQGPHYSDVIMSTMTSQITGVSVVYSPVSWRADERKHQSFASLAFVRSN